MQSNTISRSSSMQSMQGVEVERPINRQSTQFSGTSRGLSQSLLREAATREIVSKCTAIESQMPLIPVAERVALSSYLVQNNIQNSGSLSKRHQDLCAWVLLEHAAREAPKTVSAQQLQSFVQPEDYGTFSHIASNLNVNQSHFKM